MPRRLLLPLLLPGCILSREAWVEERNEAVCLLHVNCFGTWNDEDDCQDELATHVEGPCPEFSARAARACVRLMNLQASDCPTTDIRRWQIPATCADVCTSPAAGTPLAPPLPQPRRTP